MVERQGLLVTKDELLSAIWGHTVVTEDAVTHCVTDIRRALDDQSQTKLRTIPRRGYIFDLPVTASDTPSRTMFASRWLRWGLVTALVLVLGVAATWWGFGDRAVKVLATTAPHSIAVLPFADMSPNGDQEYFGDGIAEELLNELVRLDGLRVAGRTSSFSFKGTNENLNAIAEALNVGAILEGSIRKDGDRVRITAQLVNASDGYNIWSETYDRELADIFAIQEEIATSVSGALGVRLGVGGVNAFQGAGTRNIEAYEAYLQGLGSDHDESIRFLERATQLDPNYSAAWSQLGLKTAGTQWISNPEEAPEIKERAYAFVLRAVELDPESALSTSLLGTVLYARKDWIRGEAAHLRALSLLSDRRNLSQYGYLLMRTGRSAAALEQWEKAEAVEPLGGRPVGFRVYVALAQGRFADAREVLAWSAETQKRRQSRRIGPNRLSIALNEGDSEDIKATIAAMPPTAISTTALYSPVLSVFDSPEMVLSTLRATYADNGSRWPSKLHDIALLAAYFGDPEFALQTIGEEARNTDVRFQAVWYPMMSEVRQLPGFKELVTDLNLVAYWRASGWADLCQPLGDDDFECI
jgi:TolB-like protein